MKPTLFVLTRLLAGVLLVAFLLPARTQLLPEAGADPLAKTNAGRDVPSLARKVMAHETAGVISLWLLKGCQAGKPC